MFRKITDTLLTLAYPQSCHSCGKSVEASALGVSCESCWQLTRVFTGDETLCNKCGAFHSDAATGVETYCRRCDEHFYDNAMAVGVYKFALSAAVLNLKREPYVSRRLRDLLHARFFNCNIPDVDLIIPVPLSKKRRFERGFNQAEVLGAVLSGQTGLKLDDKSLVRGIHTPMHRAGMDRKARALTVKNAFQVKRKNLVAGKNMLLIDDVFTSGATVSGCARALKAAGAGKIYVLTVARTG